MIEFPETFKIIEVLKTLNNPIINTIIESYEIAVENLNASVEVLTEYMNNDKSEIESINSLNSSIKYRNNQIIILIPLLRKLYRKFYLNKESMM